MKKKKIKVRRDGDLALFKYDIGCDFADPIVCEARGIIIDINTLDVVSVAFDKFFNSHEQYAAELDWSTVRVQEKEDGSICKLFFNPHTNNWQWATNGVINAADALYDGPFYDNYLELIKNADNYNDIHTDTLDKNKTYIFEVCDPYAHTVKYNRVHLYHIGTRNNKTLLESVDDIGIEKPKEYPLHSLKECLEYVAILNKDKNNIQHEGFVAVDGAWNRIKIKNALYLKMFYMETANLSKGQILELLRTDDINVEELVKDYPRYKPQFYWYLYQLAKVESEINEFVKVVRQIYKECGEDRGVVAGRIKNCKYSYFGFKGLGNLDTAAKMLAPMKGDRFERLIEDFPLYDVRKEIE